jgi:hypothetical protein
MSETESSDSVLSDIDLLNDDDDVLMLMMQYKMNQKAGCGGSSFGKSSNRERDFEAAHQQIHDDYFKEDSLYTDEQFRRRYRMPRDLFLKIMSDLENHDPFFKRKADATGRMGASSLQKCTAAMRQLAYGISADATDEYCKISETLARKSLLHFCKGICVMYSDLIFRDPTSEELDEILQGNEDRGFPGMFGSIDCMHWEWKNCPVAHSGQYAKGTHKPSIVLEAVATQDLRIWHAFFGSPGALNDLNVLDRSPLLEKLINQQFPSRQFEINGRTYNLLYLLADGIYRDWPVFMKTLR